jgi:hypothetical protein
MSTYLVCADTITLDGNGSPSCPTGWVVTDVVPQGMAITTHADFIAVASAITGMFVVAVGIRFVLSTLLNKR